MYLWHNRLGHPSIDVLRHINPDFVNKGKKNYDPCVVCARSNQHKLPFLLNQTITKDHFELLHIDVWGPYHENSIIGARYMLTIVDDYSKAIWKFLLDHKSMVYVTLKHFIAMHN